MKRILTILLGLLTVAGCRDATPKVQENFEQANARAKEEFAAEKFGIFIHWGIYSMLGQGEWVLQTQGLKADEYKKQAGGFYPSRFDAAEWVLQTQGLKADEYKKMARGFYPSRFDAAEWVSAFKDAGARYVCITSRHHDGFSMFDTAASDFDIMDATPFKRDILKELADECHRQGLKIHFYYSLLDWTREDYWPLGRSGRDDGRAFADAPDQAPADSALTPEFWKENSLWQHYIDFMKQQLTELLTKYGEVGAIWFDGLWDRDGQAHGIDAETWDLQGIYDLIHSLQPGCLIGNNHHLAVYPGEDFQLFEKDLPGENTSGFSPDQVVTDKLPLETCQTMNDNWGYNIKDNHYKSAEELIDYLRHVNEMGANLLLNIGPRPDGTLPAEALERLRAIGASMRE